MKPEEKTPGELVKDARERAGWSQSDLGRQIGVAQATIDKIERNITKKSRHMPALSVKLGIPLQLLDPTYAGFQERSPGLAEGAQASFSHGPSGMAGARDLPVYASAEGGAGQIILTTEPIDFIPRPEPVAHVRDAYALIITGESMIPEFDQGDTAIINPRLPIFPDQTGVFYREREGEARATIKRLRRQTGDSWLVRQWNPPSGAKQDFTLSRKEWGICHRVVARFARQ